MKFFHIADLHFGKMLHNVSMVETDQSFWVDQFLLMVDLHQPDAVVIAGDVYDRSVPSVEAMKLFDRLLTGLAERGKYVFVIPGNHDSEDRLSHVSSLLSSRRIHIAGRAQRELMHVTVRDVTFWLMPFVVPKVISNLGIPGSGQDSWSSYDAAVRAYLSAQDIDPAACNVLLAHQNVLAHGEKPEHSDSETIIGGLGEIDYTAFDAFDYVALGHIHNAQKIGRNTVRYAGCPLYYDFSEIRRSKDLTLVSILSKEEITVERIEMELMHRLMQKSGTLEALLQEGAAMTDTKAYYVQCILTDSHIPPHAAERLREVYGNSLVSVRRAKDVPHDMSKDAVPSSGKGQAAPGLEEQFAAFFEEQNEPHELLDQVQETLVEKIMDQQNRHGGNYITEGNRIPDEESQELIDYLRGKLDEGT